MSVATTSPPAPTTPEVRRPGGRVAGLKELSRTTPGVLVLFTIAAVVASVLVGVLTAVSVQSRSQTLDDLALRSGPLSVAAQDIYRSLSDADATANSAFLEGGQESSAVRARYEADIAQAQASLAQAVAAREPADVVDPKSPLAVLSGQLSIYTGLVETARANNHQGLPVGAAYQREASNLMRTALLPAAEQLFKTETAARTDDQDSASAFPFLEVVLLIVMLVVLFYAQRFVRRRTRRRLNVGLVVATIATVISLAWVLLATIGVMANVNASEENGTAQGDVLAQARVDALKARGDETLTLVARGSGSVYEDDYKKVRTNVKNGLDEAAGLATSSTVSGHVRDALAAEDQWHTVHGQIRKQDDDGNYSQAVDLTIGGEDTGAAARFDKVDASLRAAITETTDSFESEVSQAGNALTGTVLGVILLALITAAGAVIGIWARLKEYR